MSSLEALFWDVDDFCRAFEPQWNRQLLNGGVKRRHRSRQLSLSEILTLLIAFHHQGYRTFKGYYQRHVREYWANAFPGLVSYQRFIDWIPSALIPLCVYLKSCFGSCSGISFMDSTSLKVCHNRRIRQHRVFRNLASRSKTSVGWFFGFKLHLVINHHGELLDCTVTPGNTDDRKPVVQLLRGCFGKVFADKGYVSKALAKRLWESQRIQFFAKPRRNMKNALMLGGDKFLARRRSLIETVIGQLKTICQIEHSRHRSPINCFVHLMAGLVAYCHQPLKPSLSL